MEQFPTDPLDALSGDDIASQRGGSRDSLLLAAQLRVDGAAEVAVRVRNLSSGGLMAEYSQPIASGTPVQVEVRGVGWIDGRIAWTAEGRIGIAFEREIDPLAARKPVAPGRSNPAVKPMRRAI